MKLKKYLLALIMSFIAVSLLTGIGKLTYDMGRTAGFKYGVGFSNTQLCTAYKTKFGPNFPCMYIEFDEKGDFDRVLEGYNNQIKDLF